MPSSLTLPDLFRACSFPQATPAEITSWATLADGSSTTGSIRVGLFGYDISCLESMCASIDNEEFYADGPDSATKGNCGLI